MKSPRNKKNQIVTLFLLFRRVSVFSGGNTESQLKSKINFVCHYSCFS